MVSERSLDIMYMKMAYNAAALSRARRRKVGAILVTPDEGRFEGINGTPSGFDNNCEEEVDDTETVTECKGLSFTISSRPIKRLVTKQEVLHAESNAIMKVTRSHSSSIGSTLYCTLAPCFECAKLIIQAGVVRVVYSEHYPYPGHNGPMRTVGLDLLERAGIKVDILPMTSQDDNERDLLPHDDGFNNPNEHRWTNYRP